MTTRHVYSSRLVPIGKPVSIPLYDGTRPERYTFDDTSFEIERTSKTKPEVWLNHDRALRIGQVGMLYTSREGWWCCDFMLDRDVPDDIEFEVGQPMSVGLSQLKIGSGEPFLREISIVRRGAVKGAEVTSRDVLKPVSPTSSPARRYAPPIAPPAGETFDYRPPIYDELERRLGYPVGDHNFESANVEASRTPLQKHYDEYVAAKRQREPQVITRYGIGRVLAVGGVPVR